MIHYLETQKKMRYEQEAVCGDSYPSLAHRLEYAYLNREDKKSKNNK